MASLVGALLFAGAAGAIGVGSTMAMLMVTAGSFLFEYYGGSKPLTPDLEIKGLSPPQRGLNFDAPPSLTKSTQVPIPIIVGNAKVGGNLLCAWTTGEEQNILKCAVGIGEGPLSSYSKVYVEDMDFEDLAYYGKGSKYQISLSGHDRYTFNLNSTGTHRNGTQVPAGVDGILAKPIWMYGTGSCVIHIMHYAPAGGSTHSWEIHYRKRAFDEIDWGSWILITAQNASYSKQVKVADGGWFHSDTYQDVATTEESEHSFVISTSGVYQIKVIASQVTSDGWLRFDSMVVTDSGMDRIVKYPHTAYAAIELKEEKTFSNPVFNFLVTGITANPAYALKTILTNKEWGFGLPSSRLHDGSFAEVATWCSTNGYYCNRAFSAQLDRTQMVEQILMCFRGMLIKSGGKLKLKVEKEEIATVSINEDDDMVSSFKFGKISHHNSPNRVRVKYVDKSEGHAVLDLILDDVEMQERDSAISEATYELYGCNTQEQAFKIGWWLYNKDKVFKNICSFKAFHRYIDCEAGDVVKITSPTAGWTDKQFRIISIQDEGDFTLSFLCLETNNTIYDIPAFDEWHSPDYMPSRYGYLQNLKPVSVSNLDCEETWENWGDDRRTLLKLTWDNPPGLFDYAKVYLSVGDQEHYYSLGSTSGEEFTYQPDELLRKHYFRVSSVLFTKDGKVEIPVEESSLIVAYPQGKTQPGFGIAYFGECPYGY